jgi:hypothetical protein
MRGGGAGIFLTILPTCRTVVLFPSSKVQPKVFRKNRVATAEILVDLSKNHTHTLCAVGLYDEALVFSATWR